jgi:hypothetical protein
MKRLHMILYALGWHQWAMSRPPGVEDAFPMSRAWVRPTRKCEHCQRQQKWLPGYGGSELGSWEDA